MELAEDLTALQQRLDGFTQKQRKQRLRELNADKSDYIPAMLLLEKMCLKYRLSAKHAADILWKGAGLGKVPTVVEIDGERVALPRDLYPMKH